MRFLRILRAPALVLVMATAAGADEPAEALSACADAALDAVEARYASVRDLKAHFSQSTRSVALGGRRAPAGLEASGSVVFAKPGRMRWTYEKPQPSETVTDGETLWIYDPANREVQQHQLSGSAYLQGAAIQFLLGEGDIRRDFRVRAENCGPDSVSLELLPRQDATYERLGLRVDPKSGEIRETTLVDLLGNVTIVTFSKVETNRDPPASVFRFDPPAGVKVLKLHLDAQ